MMLDPIIRVTELMLGLAMLQQSLEHLTEPRDRWLFLPRLGLCLLLVLGWHSGYVIWALMGVALIQLHRFDGPYNGGSDKMTFLILACLSAYYAAPNAFWQEMAISYLAIQLLLSYFVSGYIKIVNPEWRSGQALRDVFRFSAYPVSERLRGWADHPRKLWLASWGVMGFEVLLPFTLVHPLALAALLFVAACFHLSNAFFFGLNRFFWIWLCAYPALFWFQARIFG
ncbi:MAG: HTTM domain-containing protein [Pelagimonas sp.]|jgi:hypothetical protein|nr:HTTM domain-containing protein [Pelagimonas sp.]